MEGDAGNFEIPKTKLSIENAGKRYSYINRTLKNDQILKFLIQLMGLSSQLRKIWKM